MRNILAHDWKMEKATTVGSGVDFGRFESSARFQSIGVHLGTQNKSHHHEEVLSTTRL